MRRLLLCAALLLPVSCNGVDIPNPFPTPKPEPTPPVDCKPAEAKVEVACAAGEPWTDECKAAQSEWLFSPCAFDPPPDPVCDPNVGLVTECWHMPPGEHWQWIPKPVAPTPTPTPTPTPDPGTDPPAVPLIADEDLVADTTDTRKETFPLTNAAMGRWRTRHPEKWNAGGTCLIDRGAGVDAAFAAVAAELGAVDVTAGQSINKDGKRSDCIFVDRNKSRRYEETHLFHSGTGCAGTSSNVIKFTYVRSGGTPTPTPTPPPQDACTDPVPPPLLKINMKCDKPGKWPCDGTPQVLGFEYKGPGTNYCAEIGLGEMPGQPGVVRRICPLGSEDNAPRRQCWERRVLGGAALWRSFSGKVEVNPTNHLQARCAAGIDCSWIEVCHYGGLQCTRVPAP